jgi:transposase
MITYAKEELLMSLHPDPIGPVPADTARVAHAAFRKGNLYLRLRDTLGTIFTDADFVDLFPQVGQPALAPWRLALVCIFQFLEGLSDRQAAEAVRGRLDWKYALGLELTDPGFDFSVLSEFRERLLTHQAHQRLLDRLLVRLQEVGWLKAGGQQRTDATHVVMAVRQLNRLAMLTEVLQQAVESVASQVPQWMASWMPAEWVERYGRRVEESRLPKSESARAEWAEQIGVDGARLLAELQGVEALNWLSEQPEVALLHQIWSEHFERQGSRQRLRNKDDLPPEHQPLESPYDPEARFGRKGQRTWVGYKVHLTETCGEQEVHLITQVQTTAATENDSETLPAIQEDLARLGLLPTEQFLDSGYLSGPLLVSSQQQYGLRLVGPVGQDTHPQARQDSEYAQASFQLDWSAKQAICPQGQSSVWWHERQTGQIDVRFASVSCRQCEVREHCTQSKRGGSLSRHPQAEQEALRQRRQEQESEDFRQEYARRAGIEGTISQGVRAFELRRTRYRGQEKTHLQHLCIASAINLSRVDAKLRGQSPAKTRVSPLKKVAALQRKAG